MESQWWSRAWALPPSQLMETSTTRWRCPSSLTLHQKAVWEEAPPSLSLAQDSQTIWSLPSMHLKLQLLALGVISLKHHLESSSASHLQTMEEEEGRDQLQKSPSQWEEHQEQLEEAS